MVEELAEGVDVRGGGGEREVLDRDDDRSWPAVLVEDHEPELHTVVGALVVGKGHHHFPLDTAAPGVLAPTETHTVCPWKDTASYHGVQVDGQTDVDAAWSYPDREPAAAEIKDRVAFWRGVQVVD